MKPSSQFMFGESSRNLLITNPWTYAQHGHARSELRILKLFLNQHNVANQIIGISKGFGDFSRFSFGELLHKVKLDHSKRFKGYIDEKLINDLESNLYQVSRNLGHNCSGIMFTSAKVSHLFKMNTILVGQYNLAIRFIDSPDKSGLSDIFAILRKNTKYRRIVAIENKRSLNKFEKFKLPIIHVPPAQSLWVEPDLENQSRDRIGVFFPVGKPANGPFALELLNSIRHLNPIVKLPGNMLNKQIVANFHDCDFLLPGMKDEEFTNVLSKIKIAILGHENYITSSSAYASYFVSNNVPILVHSNNRFYDEFNSEFVIPLPKDIPSKISGIIKEVDSYPRLRKKGAYAIYSENQWRKFVTMCIAERRYDS